MVKESFNFFKDNLNHCVRRKMFETTIEIQLTIY